MTTESVNQVVPFSRTVVDCHRILADGLFYQTGLIASHLGVPLLGVHELVDMLSNQIPSGDYDPLKIAILGASTAYVVADNLIHQKLSDTVGTALRAPYRALDHAIFARDPFESA